MTRRFRLLLLFLVAAAPSLFARVISYAPYTNRTSLSSYHLRTSRYFALAEAPPGESPFVRAQVVLYDALGGEEPRIIYPGTTEARYVVYVAVDGGASPIQIDPPPPGPRILIATYDQTSTSSQLMYQFSSDGGKTFRRLSQLDNFQPLGTYPFDTDFGGPYAHGLTAPVVIGDGFYSFVISTTGGIFSIDRQGQIRKLADDGFVIGRSRDGMQLLVRRAQTRLEMYQAQNGLQKVLGDLPASGALFSGWITGDGSAYVLTMINGSRFLYLYRDGGQELIAGPYDLTPGALLPPGPYTSLSFFAVPTTDYNGAWMIQRQTGKPTTLSRHLPATGKETFWSDVSGPEVEALHTALDPDKLLIQVHRPRAQAERFFIDPALAVWRAGEPAPRAYDELFLNEAFSKGFVHLNVDTLAEGAPFVFDSGFTQVSSCPNCSPSPSPVGGGGDVMQEWGVVRASLKQRLVFPGVARQAGAFGSYWLSDVVIHNPLDTPQLVGFRFVPLGGQAQTAALQSTTLTLQAHEIRVLKDVLKTLFNLEQGGGALYIDPTEGVTATARTYTRAGEGSFGFGMLAIDVLNAASPRFPISFAGAFPGPEYRTNILLTDTSGRGTEARLRAHGISGPVGLDNIALGAPSSGVQQINGIAGMLNLGATDSGGLEILPTRGTMIATVVAMDNRTNDPTFFPPDLGAPVVRTIPVIGHVDGANNSKFRSDIYLFNPASVPRTVTLEAKLWDSTTNGARQPFTLLPGEARVIRDALPTLFGMTGIARLRYSSTTAGSDSDGVRVTSRTYNVDENGGTYGCLVPPLNSFQSAGAGEQLEILGIVGGTELRTNLGLVDLNPTYTGQNAEARIHIVDHTGRELDSFSITIPFAGGTQINSIFAARGIEQPAAAIVYVEVIKGLIGAYATLTDNVTNDSTFLGANLSAKAN